MSPGFYAPGPNFMSPGFYAPSPNFISLGFYAPGPNLMSPGFYALGANGGGMVQIPFAQNLTLVFYHIKEIQLVQGFKFFVESYLYMYMIMDLYIIVYVLHIFL